VWLAAAGCSCTVFGQPETVSTGTNTFALEYKLISEDVHWAPGQTVTVLPNPGEQLEKEPRHVSSHVRYGSIRLGENPDPYSYLLDESGGTGTGYDTIHFDANNNETLTDDGPGVVRTHVSESDLTQATFPPIEITLEQDGRSYPYHIRAVAETTTGNVEFGPAGYWEGEILCSGAQHKIALFDTNFNGRYDDRSVVQEDLLSTPPGDTFFIDLDGDGEISIAREFAPEACRLGKYFVVDRRCFQLDVAADGSNVTVSETDVPTGRLRFIGLGSHGDYWIELRGPDGPIKLALGRHSVPVPAGQYHIVSCIPCDEKDERNKHSQAQWTMLNQPVTVSANGRTELMLEGLFARVSAVQPKTQEKQVAADVDFGPRYGESATSKKKNAGIRPAMTNVLKAEEKSTRIGDPLIASVRAFGDRTRRIMYFGLEIRGRRGELYNPTAILQAEKRTPPPTFTVRDERDEIVLLGRFSYG
jgi:hypothetical protein